MFPFEVLNSETSAANLRATLALANRGVSKDKLTPYLRAFQLRRRIFRKPSREALKKIIRTVL